MRDALLGSAMKALTRGMERSGIDEGSAGLEVRLMEFVGPGGRSDLIEYIEGEVEACAGPAIGAYEGPAVLDSNDGAAAAAGCKAE